MTKGDNSPKRNCGAVPAAMQVQLARVFGAEFREATKPTRTNAEWRKTLQAVLQEIERYIAANIDTDELHCGMLLRALDDAEQSMKGEDFWPGYAEGITRLALCLLGDNPDHRKKKAGRKKNAHYSLNLRRSVQWTQSPEQRFRTLMMAGRVGYPTL